MTVIERLAGQGLLHFDFTHGNDPSNSTSQLSTGINLVATSAAAPSEGPNSRDHPDETHNNLSPQSLMILVSRLRHHKASVVHDKVYAVLGVAPEEDRVFTVDYDI